MVKSMATFFDLHVSMKRCPQKGEISHEIDDLVTNEFVGPTEALRVEDPRLVEDDRIVEASTKCESGVAQSLYFAGEAKRTRRREFSFVGFFVDG